MGRTLSLVLLALALLPLEAIGQVRARVYFTDKALTSDDRTPGGRLHKQVMDGFARESILRRMRTLQVSDPALVIDEADYPLSSDYVEAVAGLGFQVESESRWLNMIGGTANSDALEQIAQLPFVDGIQILRAPTAEVDPRPHLAACEWDSTYYRSGLAAWQLDRIHVRPLHAMGLDATGVTIAYFDTGFSWRTNRALQTRRIIAERDFVHEDDNTEDEVGDPENQDAHGTGVLGVAAAYVRDTVIGPAFNADLLLAKTEDLRSETPREEENYAMAVEWAEARGARIISSSLGYVTFDSGFTSYRYEDLNGQTAISTRAVQRAVRLGMLVVTAAGNSGGLPFPWVNAPADADSILAVGAMHVNDTIAPFSSHGPTVDGRIKPDVVAPGVFVWSYDPTQGPVPIGGTSNATPLVSASAALVWQAHPNATAEQVRQSMIRTSSLADTPDNIYGWGMINAYKAAVTLGPFVGMFEQSVQPDRISICASIAGNEIESVNIHYRVDDEPLRQLELTELADSNMYFGELVFPSSFESIRYFLEARESGESRLTLPNGAPVTLYEYRRGSNQVTLSAPRPTSVPIALVQNVVRDHLTLTFDEFLRIRVRLIDVLGRVQLDREYSSVRSDLSISLREFPTGSYLLHIEADGGVRTLPLRVVR